MTKDRIKQIIKECLQNSVNEGSANRETYWQWENIKEVIGAERMLNELFEYMSSDEIEDFIIHMIQHYDI